MLIKYLGPKESKKVYYKTTQYVFDPICEVTDPETLRFLLHPDRDGLFEVVKEEPDNSSSENSNDSDNSDQNDVQKKEEKKENNKKSNKKEDKKTAKQSAKKSEDV